MPQPVSIADLGLNDSGIIKNEITAENITSTPVIDNNSLEVFPDG
jgi:hypothetical protein